MNSFFCHSSCNGPFRTHERIAIIADRGANTLRYQASDEIKKFRGFLNVSRGKNGKTQATLPLRDKDEWGRARGRCGKFAALLDVTVQY